MQIRTKENLIDRISDEHVWRIREISELKSLIEEASISKVRKSVLCRSGIALLYAHWEGFVKKSGTYFLEYVSYQRLQQYELKSNFITLSIKEKIDNAAQSKKYSTFDEIIQYIRENNSSRVRVPFKNVINTQSNLSTNVLKEILWCLGLDYKDFEAKEKLIDLQLVARRNHVAHGEVLEVNDKDFLEMSEEVITLMLLFKNLLENSATLESYKN